MREIQPSEIATHGIPSEPNVRTSIPAWKRPSRYSQKLEETARSSGTGQRQKGALESLAAPAARMSASDIGMILMVHRLPCAEIEFRARWLRGRTGAT
jgi:hypothetical protein